ncbi:MAG: F0F1 ATP synthase subunit B [Muribaculaceae bacterium]|nr:F0F1 ATP synthase subunit B [Muribaculaceae bacterium]
MELFKPDFGLVFWMFVAFAILFLLLWRKGWPAIMKMIDGRADLIDKGVEYAQQAKEQLDKAQESAEQIIADARRSQADILREAGVMKDQIVEQARQEARAAAQKEMESARVAIAQERKEAEKQFRDQVSAFALDIASKVTRRELADDKAQTQLVNNLLDEIEKTN